VGAGQPPPPDGQVSTLTTGFSDDLDGFDDQLWSISDGWTNGPPFWCGWRADHVDFSSGVMRLRLDDVPCVSNPDDCSGQPYASGEYWTIQLYPYGRVEARLKPARQEGVVTSLFTYTGPSDGNPHDEIDIEFLGRDTTMMEVNYYVNGVGGHEAQIALGFDAADAFHVYAFEWSPTAIHWFVDDVLVHTETNASGPLPSTPGHVMVNLWPGIGVDAWLGPFVYPGSPIYADYDWIRYEPSPTVFSDGFEEGTTAAWSTTVP
jgi:beta-glucanase (GH16 family)